MFKDLAPAVKKETLRVAVVTAALIVIMWIAFGIGHAVSPEQIPFNYTVILGGLGGGFIAILNVFMMGVTVQKVAGTENEDDARAKMRMSYSQRMLLQIIWIIIAIAAPCFHFAAGIAPLFFPSIGIKLRAIFPFLGKIGGED
jgi:hypothetical protein